MLPNLVKFFWSELLFPVMKSISISVPVGFTEAIPKLGERLGLSDGRLVGSILGNWDVDGVWDVDGSCEGRPLGSEELVGAPLGNLDGW